MTYEEWEEQVAPEIKNGPVWRFYGYRKALFLHDRYGRTASIGKRSAGVGRLWSKSSAAQVLSVPMSKKDLDAALGVITHAS